MEMGSRSAAAAVVACLLLSAEGLAAQEAAGGVTERNNQAVALSQEGKLMEAAVIWLDLIDEVGPDNQYLWGFHMNVGRNFQKLALFPEAWWHLQKSVSLNPGEKTRAFDWLEEVENALKQTHRRVTVVVGNPGGRMRLLHGDRPTWYKAPLEWWFKPGEESLDVAADGIESAPRRFTVSAETREVVLRLDAVAVTDPIKPPVDGGKKPEARRSRPVLPWVLLGGAVLLAGGGGATWWVASSNLEGEKTAFVQWMDDKWGRDGKVKAGEEGVAEAEWDSRMSARVTPFEVSSYVLWGAAGAAATGGIIWLAVDASRNPGEDDAAHPAFVPMLLPGGAGAAIQLPF